ncbi:MAG: hypothetical protein EOO61_10945 [Hymenobacter sp.]|nr:MAG: hypothetical protein EOO61_10945 [Hymenobacter sp.]
MGKPRWHGAGGAFFSGYITRVIMSLFDALLNASAPKDYEKSFMWGGKNAKIVLPIKAGMQGWAVTSKFRLPIVFKNYTINPAQNSEAKSFFEDVNNILKNLRVNGVGESIKNGEPSEKDYFIALCETISAHLNRFEKLIEADLELFVDCLMWVVDSICLCITGQYILDREGQIMRERYRLRAYSAFKEHIWINYIDRCRPNAETKYLKLSSVKTCLNNIGNVTKTSNIFPAIEEALKYNLEDLRIGKFHQRMVMGAFIQYWHGDIKIDLLSRTIETDEDTLVSVLKVFVKDIDEMRILKKKLL